MNNYSEMSDLEINELVAKCMGLHLDNDAIISHPQVRCGNDEDGCRYGWCIRDYCNNPSDAWPIIAEHRISLFSRCANNEWKAQIHLGLDDIFDNYASSWDKNPLRAAMIVYLMMKDGENA